MDNEHHSAGIAGFVKVSTISRMESKDFNCQFSFPHTRAPDPRCAILLTLMNRRGILSGSLGLRRGGLHHYGCLNTHPQGSIPSCLQNPRAGEHRCSCRKRKIGRSISTPSAIRLERTKVREQKRPKHPGDTTGKQQHDGPVARNKYRARIRKTARQPIRDETL